MDKRLLGLSLLLVASLAANAGLWLGAPGHASGTSLAATDSAPRQKRVDPEPARACASAVQSVAQCEQALRECKGAPGPTFEAMRTDTVASLDAGAMTLDERIAALRPRADARVVAIDARVATPQLQQEIISQMGREHMRREWERKKDQTVRDVLTDLRNPTKQHEDFERDVQQYGRVLGLENTDPLRTRYEPIHTRRLQQVEAALGHEPPDFASVLAELRGLYADEDQLVESLRGADAQSRFRLSQLEKRTVILGIAATFAQVPWDQNIWWGPGP